MSSQEIKFRAGVCDYDEDTFLCTPIACQGEIEIKPHEEEDLGFWELEWRPIERPIGTELKPISLILIPGETRWLPLHSSKNGRIFALVFSSNQKYLFWLQEKNPANLALNELSKKDQQLFEKMMHILNYTDDDDNNDVDMKDS